MKDSASILLLDDDPDIGLAALLLLQRRVAPVTCLRRPAELAAALDRVNPSLLLLDLNFGPGRCDGAQGLQLLTAVQSRPRPPVVVVMTAYADIALAVQALKRGAFDFITKPWDNVRLIAVCHEAIQHHAAELGSDTATTPIAPIASMASIASITSTSAEPARNLATQERASVLAAMAQAQGNLSEAARILGLSRGALYRRLDKHGL